MFALLWIFPSNRKLAFVLNFYFLASIIQLLCKCAVKAYLEEAKRSFNEKWEHQPNVCVSIRIFPTLQVIICSLPLSARRALSVICPLKREPVAEERKRVRSAARARKVVSSYHVPGARQYFSPSPYPYRVFWELTLRRGAAQRRRL